MIIALPAEKMTLLSEIAPDIDTARYFIIVDPEHLTDYQLLHNPYLAGETSGEVDSLHLFRKKGVELLMAENCRPELRHLYEKEGIPFQQAVPGSIIDNLIRYRLEQMNRKPPGLPGEGLY